MVQTCSAYGCKNRYHKDKDISFHKFPLARPDVGAQWVAAMRRNNFKPTKYSNICSQHFSKDCFKRECNNRVLKDNAVPTRWRDYISRLALERLGIPQNELESVAGEREAWVGLLNLLPPSGATQWPSPATTTTRRRILLGRRSGMEQLEEQLGSLRKKLKTTQQKCRRQERELKRLKACEAPRAGEGYVILPKHIYYTLKGIK
uniref:THAP domain-containing protein 1 n=1 Tax=Cyclopterus lumpus TaxID=8103 RepID=A0A8C2WQN1_CYCLU